MKSYLALAATIDFAKTGFVQKRPRHAGLLYVSLTKHDRLTNFTKGRGDCFRLPIDCVIQNLSKGGAALDIGTQVGIPR